MRQVKKVCKPDVDALPCRMCDARSITWLGFDSKHKPYKHYENDKHDDPNLKGKPREPSFEDARLFGFE